MLVHVGSEKKYLLSTVCMQEHIVLVYNFLFTGILPPTSKERQIPSLHPAAVPFGCS